MVQSTGACVFKDMQKGTGPITAVGGGAFSKKHLQSSDFENRHDVVCVIGFLLMVSAFHIKVQDCVYCIVLENNAWYIAIEW